MTKTAELHAPLDGATEGHLVVHRGLGATTISTDRQLPDLMAGRWSGRGAPRAKVHGGTVELTFPRVALGLTPPARELRLNGSVPWRIEIDGGVGDVTADLTGASVLEVAVGGGMARSRVELPDPTGTMVVRLGSVSDVEVVRPAGVPVRVRVRRGSRDLTVDGQSFGAVGGPTTIATPGFDTAANRLDVLVDASSHLTVTQRS